MCVLTHTLFVTTVNAGAIRTSHWGLDLTRLRGHLMVSFGGVHNGQQSGPVHQCLIETNLAHSELPHAEYTHFTCRIKVSCSHSRAGGASDHISAGRASAPTFLERFGSEHRRHFGRMRTYNQSPCSARELVNRNLWGMASRLSPPARRRDARSHDVELYSRWLHIG